MKCKDLLEEISACEKIGQDSDLILSWVKLILSENGKPIKGGL